MSAAVEALQLARQCGVRVKADGADLILDAAAPPPAKVIDVLRHHKAEIVDLLAHADSRQVSAAAISAWDAETAQLNEWFLHTPPPAGPFELCRGVTILRPVQYWRDLEADITCGPKRARGYTGALKGDLRKLHGLFGPRMPEAEDEADGG